MQVLTNGSDCLDSTSSVGLTKPRTTEVRFYCTPYRVSTADTGRMDMHGYGLQPKSSKLNINRFTTVTSNGYAFFNDYEIPEVTWIGALQEFPHSLNSVKEGPTCHYLAKFSTPVLCNHPAFMQDAPIPPSRVQCENGAYRFGGWYAPFPPGIKNDNPR
eukprot:gb/GECG01013224.1/.p1 GENE.gb/GECG01013224.1/~~gb/GECG01013224.1/.p1  ORF type:complete len:159 (+),score=9.72 gb/GECG01013224.1/:1-477(+)